MRMHWESHSPCRSGLAQGHLTLFGAPWLLLPPEILPGAVRRLRDLLPAPQDLLCGYVWEPCPGGPNLGGNG